VQCEAEKPDFKVYNGAEKGNQRPTPMLHHPLKSLGEILHHGTNRTFPETKLPRTLGRRNTENSKACRFTVANLAVF
jgi:hypothetical protein